MSKRARLVICEPFPRWAVLLRRFQQPPRRQLSEARSLQLASDLFAESPASFVCLAVTEKNAAQALGQVHAWSHEFHAASIAVLLDSADEEFERGFLEAGAQLVATSVFQLPSLLDMAERHFRNVVEPDLPWPETIVAQMPWQKGATTK